jgi:hypothetical protein
MPAIEQAKSVWIMPALNRKIAAIAAAERTKDQGPRIDAPEQRYVKRQPKAAELADLVKSCVQSEPDCEIEDHTNHGGGDARERAA